MPQHIYRSAHDLAKLIREGQATSVEIVKEHVTRIKERNSELNAFVNVFDEEALAVAAERDQQAEQGRFVGPLHGVPVSIKEQYWIQGKSCTINAKMHKDFVAPEDAVIVDRIRKSGAVILGQTNIPRFLQDFQVLGTSTLKVRTPTTRIAAQAVVPAEEPRRWRPGFRPSNWGVIWAGRSESHPTSAAFTG